MESDVSENFDVDNDRYEKCDVFQVYALRTINLSVAFEKLQQHVKRSGSDVYAVRIDATDEPNLAVTWGVPLDVMTAWSSKNAYDKWHLVNDQMLQDLSILEQMQQDKASTKGNIPSHYHLVYRFDSTMLSEFENKKNGGRIVRLDIARRGAMVIPKTEITVSGSGDAHLNLEGFMNNAIAHRPHRVLYIFDPEELTTARVSNRSSK
jgi:hypothetical protein